MTNSKFCRKDVCFIYTSFEDEATESYSESVKSWKNSEWHALHFFVYLWIEPFREKIDLTFFKSPATDRRAQRAIGPNQN